MDKTKKKYVILVVVTIVISIVALLGASYALLTMTLEGDKKITLTAGILKVDFTDGNYINLENQAPVSDAKGQKMTPYTFTITNTGNINAYYHVSLEEEVTNTLTNNYLKMRLTNDKGYDSGVVKVSDLGSGNFEIKGEEKLEPGEDNKVTYTLWMWLSEDADNGAQGKEYKSKIVVTSYDRKSPTVGNTLLENIPKENQYDDGVDTFITGEDPNNYIWYSGKLWRAVSVNNDAKTTKLVTQWNISSITYSSSSTDFAGSYMEDWLNDTSADGFLGNLRDYENFIVTDAKWNATLDATSLGSITRPSDSGTIVTDAVGLLNMYEYQSSYNGTTYSNGYLNNGLYWWTITPYSSSDIRRISTNGSAEYISSIHAFCVRPSINLKSNIRIVDGDGTVDNPYRLNGDNDSNLSGTLLNTRYSGEYIKFGNDENKLYRIVSHETSGLTKITSAEPLKSSGNFLSSAFDSNSGVNYSNANTIGSFLNNDYLNIENGYLTNEDIAMIEESSTWYLGTVANGVSYKLAKYTDVTGTESISSIATAKVGLLRFGELMAGQFNIYRNNTSYWTITVYSSNYIRSVDNIGDGDAHSSDSDLFGIKPSLNLKSNVIITSGTGTKSDPFVLTLSS